MTDVNRHHGNKWMVFVSASFGWGRGVEAASMGWNPGLHIWSLNSPGFLHPSEMSKGAYDPLGSWHNTGFQPEDTLWPIDFLALGLRDEMTDWEQLGREDLRCRCQRWMEWIRFMWILDGAA
jgi:hypothetical protein